MVVMFAAILIMQEKGSREEYEILARARVDGQAWLYMQGGTMLHISPVKKTSGGPDIEVLRSNARQSIYDKLSLTAGERNYLESKRIERIAYLKDRIKVVAKAKANAGKSGKKELSAKSKRYSDALKMMDEGHVFIPRSYLNNMDAGMVAGIPDNPEVVQIIDKNSMTVYLRKKVYWINASTEGVTDDDKLKMTDIYRGSGPKSYTDINGAKRTVGSVTRISLRGLDAIETD